MHDFKSIMELKSQIALAFGTVLREIRTKKRFSQASLATECDLERKFIHLLERGVQQPSLTTIFKLATALETSPNEIVKMVEKGMKDDQDKGGS